MMDNHFSAVADHYRELRTEDLEPVIYIRDHLPSRPSCGLDVGCGTGRYTERLFEALPKGTTILGADHHCDMIRVFRRRRPAGAAIRLIQARAEELPIRPQTFDWVVTFNAIHHVDLPRFLRCVARILRSEGKLFIYTRTPEQNARSVWGRFFPGFVEKETRLWSEGSLRATVDAIPEIGIRSVETFRYERVSTPERLREQAEHAHYSTFSLYHPDEFSEALETFLRRVSGPAVRWSDENLMLVCKRRP